MKIIRVFPRRTKATPVEELVSRLTPEVMPVNKSTFTTLVIKAGYYRFATTGTNYCGCHIKPVDAPSSALRTAVSRSAIFIELLKSETASALAFHYRIWFSGYSVFAYCSMACPVKSVRRVNFQIFGAIIYPIPINVMNDFVPLQLSIKHLFCHKAVFVYVSSFICERMIRCQDQNIPMLSNQSTRSHIDNSFTLQLLYQPWREKSSCNMLGERDIEWMRFQKIWARPTIVATEMKKAAAK